MLKLATRNAWFNGLATIAQMVIGLLFAGYTIRLLGEERAGYWITIQGIVAISSALGGFGLGTAAIRRMAICFNEDNTKAARSCLAAVLFVNAITGLLVAIFFYLFAPQIFVWSKLDQGFLRDALSATALVGLAFFVNQFSSTYALTYIAAQRYDLVALVGTVFGLLSGSLGLVVLTFWPYMKPLALLSLGLGLLQLLTNMFLAGRILKRVTLPSMNWGELRPMLGFGGWTYLGSLGTLLISQLDRVLIITFLGSAVLPYYVFPQRIVQIVHSSMTNQASFLFPMLSGDAAKRPPRLVGAVDKLRWLVASFTVAVYGVLALIGVDLMRVVVSPDFAQKAKLFFYLAMLQGVFLAIMIVPYYISWALGDARPNAFVSNGQGVVVLGSMLLLIPSLGVLGASLSQMWVIPASIIHVLWVNRILTSQAKDKDSQLSFVSAYLGPISMAVVLSIAALWAGMRSQTSVLSQAFLWVTSIILASALWYAVERFAMQEAGRLEILGAVFALVKQRLMSPRRLGIRPHARESWRSKTPIPTSYTERE